MKCDFRKLTFGTVISAAMAAASPAFAGMIYVAPDVNAFSVDSAGALAQILSGNATTGVVTGNTASLGDFLPNVSQTVLSDFSPGSLSPIDLLAIGGPSYFSSGPLGLTSSEISNIRAFLVGGGDVLLQVETNNVAGDYSSYNSFLTGIGSTIQFTGERDPGRTDFGSFWQCNACNVLTGGTETAATYTSGQFTGSLAFAAENITGEQPEPVPAPATFALFGLGLAGLGWSRRKKA